MSNSLLDITLFALNHQIAICCSDYYKENAKHYLWIPFSQRTKGSKSSFMQLKASVWKPSKSVVEIADELELRGHIQSSRLIYFLYVFDSLANNFRRPKMTLSDVYSYILTCF